MTAQRLLLQKHSMIEFYHTFGILTNVHGFRQPDDRIPVPSAPITQVISTIGLKLKNLPERSANVCTRESSGNLHL